jgi:hypothetical protein
VHCAWTAHENLGVREGATQAQMPRECCVTAAIENRPKDESLGEFTDLRISKFTVRSKICFDDKRFRIGSPKAPESTDLARNKHHLNRTLALGKGHLRIQTTHSMCVVLASRTGCPGRDSLASFAMWPHPITIFLHAVALAVERRFG